MKAEGYPNNGNPRNNRASFTRVDGGYQALKKAYFMIFQLG